MLTDSWETVMGGTGKCFTQYINFRLYSKVYRTIEGGGGDRLTTKQAAD